MPASIYTVKRARRASVYSKSSHERKATTPGNTEKILLTEAWSAIRNNTPACIETLTAYPDAFSPPPFMI